MVPKAVRVTKRKKKTIFWIKRLEIPDRVVHSTDFIGNLP